MQTTVVAKTRISKLASRTSIVALPFVAVALAGPHDEVAHFGDGTQKCDRCP